MSGRNAGDPHLQRGWSLVTVESREAAPPKGPTVEEWLDIPVSPAGEAARSRGSADSRLGPFEQADPLP